LGIPVFDLETVYNYTADTSYIFPQQLLAKAVVLLQTQATNDTLPLYKL